MKNSSHSGIDFNKLKNEFNKFKQIPFPGQPEDDDLYDLYSELVEIDGYIAGVMSSLIKTKKINRSSLYINDDFNKQLLNIKINNEQAKKDLAAYIDYKRNLDNLINIVLKMI